jgi:hypothetical protein
LDNKHLIYYIDEILKLSKEREHDTALYKQLLPDSNVSVIFIYTLINKLLQFDKQQLLSNEGSTLSVIYITLFLIYTIDKFSLIYKNLFTHYTHIKEIYDKLIKKNKKIFSILKIRQDEAHQRNPRFKIKIKDNKYLLVQYTNIDKQIGYVNGTYDHNFACKQIDDIYINEQVKKDTKAKKDELAEKAKQIRKPKQIKQMEIDEPLEKTKKEFYYFGPYDKIFDIGDDNKYIADNSTEIFLDKLKNWENICVIGLGQSGSGKTSTLIYRNDTNEYGIILELCAKSEIYLNYDKITLKSTNIYTSHNIRDKSSANETNGLPIEFTYIDNGWKNNESILSNMILEILKDSQRLCLLKKI